MPRGTRHTLNGTLGWDDRNRLHVLTMEGGGYWFLDLPLFTRTHHLMDREVTVEGVRTGFNLLNVSNITATGSCPPSKF